MPRPTAHDEALIREGVAVRLIGAHAGYGASDVLNGATFEARTGEMHVISGPAGAGKSLLIEVLRLRRPLRAGAHLFLGVDIAQTPLRRRTLLKRRIGVVDCAPIFFEHLSILENAGLPLRLQGRPGLAEQKDLLELLDFVGVSAPAHTPVHALSPGERRHVALARALAAKPDLILADDPAGGLAPDAARRTERVLSRMRDVGACVVAVSPDPGFGHAADPVQWRLSQGRLIREAG